MPSAAERKKLSDLIRHRELNALRRVMQRARPSPGTLFSPPNANATASLQAITASTQLHRLDVLEAQVTRTLFTRAADHLRMPTAPGTDIATPQPEPLNTPAAATPETHAVHETLVGIAHTFAQGHILLAKTQLQRALGPSGSLRAHMQAWLFLLDFYRATNERQAFDAAAIDYAIRFGRSSPDWLALDLQQSQPSSSPDSGETNRFEWSAPPLLDQTSMRHLKLLLLQCQDTHGTPVLRMDWRGLTAIDGANWEDLATFFSSLARTPVRSQWFGLEHLQAALAPQNANPGAVLEPTGGLDEKHSLTLFLSHPSSRMATPVPKAQMMAYLEMLRCIDARTRFEDGAAAYCVLYEQSPPEWKIPLCEVTCADSPLDAAASVAAEEQHRRTRRAGTKPQTAHGPSPHLAADLTGHLEGALSAQVLAVLDRASGQSGMDAVLPLSCSHLIRCDKAAAQALLRWAIGQKTHSRTVEFREVHRVLATFLISLGFEPHARVSIRKN